MCIGYFIFNPCNTYIIVLLLLYYVIQILSLNESLNLHGLKISFNF